MITYIPCILPVTWMLDRWGLRVIAIIGASLGALGACIKILACNQDRFEVIVVGQVVSSIGNVS